MSVILSVGLFVLTLLIIFVLRASDSKTRSVANVKKMVEQIHSDVEKFDSSLKQEVADIEMQIGKNTTQVRELIQTVAAQIVELKTYSDDFGSLHEAMAKYQSSLTALARLTEDADAKVEKVNQDVESLQEVKESINSFRLEIAEIEKTALKQITDSAEEETNSFKEKVESYVSQIDTLLNALASAVQNAGKASEELNAKLDEIKKPFGSDFEVQDMSFSDFDSKTEGEKLDD